MANMCKECSKQQTTCCSSPRVPFLMSDIQRIGRKYNPRNFLIAGQYEVEETDEDWWLYSKVEIGKNLYKLNVKKKEDGSCFFLTSLGCGLGNDRPIICKIYPLWVNSKDEIVYDILEEGECLIYKMIPNIDSVIKLMGETSESIKGYFQEIKRDCLNNKEKHKKQLEAILN